MSLLKERVTGSLSRPKVAIFVERAIEARDTVHEALWSKRMQRLNLTNRRVLPLFVLLTDEDPT